MTQDIKLSDLIDIKTLQTIQDQFSKMTGMAALTTDENGMPVTKPSNFTRFCTITRNSKTGCKRCIQCDSFSANNALEEGDHHKDVKTILKAIRLPRRHKGIFSPDHCKRKAYRLLFRRSGTYRTSGSGSIQSYCRRNKHRPRRIFKGCL